MPPLSVGYFLKVARNQSVSLFRAFSILNFSSNIIQHPPHFLGFASVELAHGARLRGLTRAAALESEALSDLPIDGTQANRGSCGIRKPALSCEGGFVISGLLGLSGVFWCLLLKHFFALCQCPQAQGVEADEACSVFLVVGAVVVFESHQFL